MGNFLEKIDWNKVKKTSLYVMIGVFSMLGVNSILVSYGLESIKSRLIFLGIAVSVITSIIVLNLLITKWKGERLSKVLGGKSSSLSKGKYLDVESLRESFKESIQLLKHSEMGVSVKGAAALYKLPWFLMIGPAAAGKSTILQQSSLTFPKNNDKEIQIKGYGGTRNCDWWFSSEGVFLDTAGRYTTEVEDQKEWFEFLGLLKKYRKKQPLNGIIVAINLEDIVTLNGVSGEKHIKLIRERIDEITKRLGYWLPIHILITKCDKIRGFDSFYKYFSEAERQQVWGVNLSTDGDKLFTIRSSLDQICETLGTLRTHIISVEPDQEQKELVFDFPEQFRIMADLVFKFCRGLLQENPYQETPNFCGFYFTSGLQEGKPFERIDDEGDYQFISSKDDENSVERSRHSCFISELFRNIIIKDQNKAQLNKRKMKLNQTFNKFALGGLSIFSVFYILHLSMGYKLNHRLLNQSELLAKNVLNYESDYGDLVISQGKLYNHMYDLVNIDNHVPWIRRLGLISAKNNIKTLRTILNSSLGDTLGGQLEDASESQLREVSEMWQNCSLEDKEYLREKYYKALELYLLARYPEEKVKKDATHLIYEFWKKWLIDNKKLSSNTILKNEWLVGLAEEYVDQNIAKRSDSINYISDSSISLIKKARHDLSILNYDPSEYYTMLKTRIESKHSYLTLYDLIDSSSNHILENSSTISPFYMVETWKESILPELETLLDSLETSDWVLDSNLNIDSNLRKISNEKSSEIKQYIRAKYFESFQREWVKFITRVKVKPFLDLNEATMNIGILASGHGPISSLMIKVKNEFIALETYVGRSLGDTVAEKGTILESIKIFTESSEDVKETLTFKAYLTTLARLQSEYERVWLSPDRSRDVQDYARKMLSNVSTNNTELLTSSTFTHLIAKRIPNKDVQVAMHSLMSSPLQESWRAMLNEAVNGLQGGWESKVVSVYNKSLRNKYPFSVNDNDASLYDLSHFFHPKKGILWGFVNSSLSSFIKDEGSHWVTRKWMNVGPDFSDEFLSYLSSAKMISNSLFKDGMSEPEFSFQIYPMSAPNLSEYSLFVAGNTFRYRNEPQEWVRFKWPGEEMVEMAWVKAKSVNSGKAGNINCDGVWGFFRLLEKAYITNDSYGLSYKAKWKLSTSDGEVMPVNIKIKPERTSDAFKSLLFTRSPLPDDILLG